MQKGETQLGSTVNQIERTVSSIMENKDIAVTTEWKNLKPDNLVSDGHGHTPNNENQRTNIVMHNKLHPLMVRECKNCGILTETNEFCFNLLESKLGNKTDGHLEQETMLNEKGPLRYFGRTLATCSKCENLQIHSLFSKHEENSSLRLNLGGFSPVLFHNVFKTCESKGNDIECRLVILGARPRSSPAYAVSNEHTTACSAFCQDCHYQSPNSHHRSSHPELSYSDHQPRDYHPSIYKVSSDASEYQRDRPNAVSLYSPSQASSLVDTPDDYSSSAPSTRQHSNESNARIKKLTSPSSQNTAVSVVCSIVKPTPNETVREINSSTPRNGGLIFKRSSPPTAGVGIFSCEPKKYPISSHWEIEAARGGASAIIQSGITFPFDAEASISSMESKPLIWKEVDSKAQNKRMLDSVDEKDCPILPKKHPRVCSVSNTQNVNEISVKDAPLAQSLNLDYSQPSVSEEIIKPVCSNVSKSNSITEVTLDHGISVSLNIVQPSVISLSSKSKTSAEEAPTSCTTQIDHVSREDYSRMGGANASKSVSPIQSDKPEARRWKPANLKETEIVNLNEKTDINTTDLRDGNEEKKDVSNWSNGDVVSFLIESDYSEYADVFKQEDIDGQALLLLDEEKLHSLLGIKMGPAMKIARHIRNLQASLSFESENLTGK